MDKTSTTVLLPTGAAVVRINDVPDGMFPEGISGNDAQFSDDSGRQRLYHLPFGDGERCSIRNIRISADNCATPVEFQELVHDPQGPYRANISISSGGGAYWAVIVPEPALS